MRSEVTIGEGTPQTKGWPFADLEIGKFFQISDLEQYASLRTAASRAGKKLTRRFAVRKTELKVRGKPRTVLRVYRVS